MIKLPMKIGRENVLHLSTRAVSPQPKVYYRFCSSLNLKPRLGYFVHPSLNFLQGGEKVQNLALMFDTSHFNAL